MDQHGGRLRARWIRDCAGRKIRLTDERWRHILEHPEMRDQERKLRTTLKKPEQVLSSRSDPTVHLYYRFFGRSPVGPKYLMVGVKFLDGDAFVITAFFTDRATGGSQLWPL